MAKSYPGWRDDKLVVEVKYVNYWLQRYTRQGTDERGRVLILTLKEFLDQHIVVCDDKITIQSVVKI